MDRYIEYIRGSKYAPELKLLQDRYEYHRKKYLESRSVKEQFKKDIAELYRKAFQDKCHEEAKIRIQEIDKIINNIDRDRPPCNDVESKIFNCNIVCQDSIAKLIAERIRLSQ